MGVMICVHEYGQWDASLGRAQNSIRDPLVDKPFR